MQSINNKPIVSRENSSPIEDLKLPSSSKETEVDELTTLFQQTLTIDANQNTGESPSLSSTSFKTRSKDSCSSEPTTTNDPTTTQFINLSKDRPSHKDSQLLKMIKDNDPTIRAQLLIANESIIKSTDLFSLMYNEFLDDKLASDDAQVLLRFCLDWIVKNHGTLQMKDCSILFNDLRLKTLGHDDTQIRLLSRAIKKELDLESQVAPIERSQERGTKGIEMESILESIRNGNVLKNYYTSKKYAKKIASDFQKFQIKFLKTLKAGDIATLSKTAPSYIAEYAKTCNAISFGITEAILQEPDPKKVRQMMVFFVDIAQSCFDNKDFASLAAIMAGISHNSIFRLTTICNALPPAYKNRLKTLSAVVSQDEGYRKYKEQIKDLRKQELSYIPYFVPFAAEMARVQEREKVEELEDGTVRYSLYKLQKTADAIETLLWPKSQFEQSSKPSTTDLFFGFLKGKERLSEDAFYQLSYKLKKSNL